MESSSKHEEQKRINEMIENSTDDLGNEQIKQACQSFVLQHQIDDTFDVGKSWDKFAEKYGKIMEEEYSDKQTNTRASVIDYSKSNKTCSHKSIKPRKRLLVLAAVLTMIPFASVVASPVKKMLCCFTDNILIQNSESVSSSNISAEGLYMSFEDVPFDIIYPDSDVFALTKSIEINQLNSVVATLESVECPTNEIQLYINDTATEIYAEKTDGEISTDVHHGIEFCNTFNHNWMISVWEYNGLRYSLYIPKENAEEIYSLFVSNLCIPVSDHAKS